MKSIETMKKILSKSLFIYSAIASVLIAASSFYTLRGVNLAVFSLLFLPVVAYFVVELFNKNTQTNFRKGEILLVLIFFVIFFSIGARNVFSSKTIQELPSPTPTAIHSPETPAPSATTTTVSIKISDGSKAVNIRLKPTIYSPKVGEAVDGDVFELIKKEGDWYMIKFEGATGYISGKYVKTQE